MRPSSPTQESQFVAQSEPDVPRVERVAILLGLSAFVVVIAIGFALYLVHFQVDHRIVNASLAFIAAGAATTFFRTRPASKLTPVERVVRGRRLVCLTLGLLTGAAVLGSIATAAELNSLEDWAMLGFIASSPIGLYFLVYTKFGMA